MRRLLLSTTLALLLPMAMDPVAAAGTDVAYYHQPFPGYAPVDHCVAQVLPQPAVDCPADLSPDVDPDWNHWIQWHFPFSSGTSSRARVWVEDDLSWEAPLFHVRIGEGGKYQKGCIRECIVTESSFVVSVAPGDITVEELVTWYAWQPLTSGRIVVEWS